MPHYSDILQDSHLTTPLAPKPKVKFQMRRGTLLSMCLGRCLLGPGETKPHRKRGNIDYGKRGQLTGILNNQPENTSGQMGSQSFLLCGSYWED